jgi:hypothetical protein
VKKVFIKSMSKTIRSKRGRSIGHIRLKCRVEVEIGTMKIGTKPPKF